MSLPLSPCLKSPRKLLLELESNVESNSKNPILPPSLEPLHDSSCSLESGSSRKVSIEQLHDSIRSIFSDEDEDDGDVLLETTFDNSSATALDLNSSMMFEPDELDQSHLEMIQEDWQVLKESHEDPSMIGSELLELLLAHGQSSATVPRGDGDRGSFIVDTLDHLMFNVLTMGPDAREAELDEVGNKLLDEGIDVKLLYKALRLYLESKECVSDDEAWETFRDILYKLDCVF